MVHFVVATLDLLLQICIIEYPYVPESDFRFYELPWRFMNVCNSRLRVLSSVVINTTQLSGTRLYGVRSHPIWCNTDGHPKVEASWGIILECTFEAALDDCLAVFSFIMIILTEYQSHQADVPSPVILPGQCPACWVYDPVRYLTWADHRSITMMGTGRTWWSPWAHLCFAQGSYFHRKPNVGIFIGQIDGRCGLITLTAYHWRWWEGRTGVKGQGVRKWEPQQGER